ncbi:MAG: uroporphyrinogen-III synthase [Gemmatimonadota bacterium]
MAETHPSAGFPAERTAPGRTGAERPEAGQNAAGRSATGRPLAGATVVTTRTRDPEDPLVRRLQESGARVRVWPTLHFAPTSQPRLLAEAAQRMDDYDWVVFTSARAVEPMAAAAGHAPDTARVAAVGRATAAALEAAGWPVHLTGGGGAAALARAVAALLPDRRAGNARVLFPAGSLARPTLEEILEEAGAGVRRVEAYRTLPARPDPDQVAADLHCGVDVVTFASPSAVDALFDALPPEVGALLDATPMVAIGSTTLEALRERGRTHATQAPEASWDGVAAACVQILTTPTSPDESHA